MFFILSYLFLVFCFPARFWCRDIGDGFKYPRGYPHVRHRLKKHVDVLGRDASTEVNKMYAPFLFMFYRDVHR